MEKRMNTCNMAYERHRLASALAMFDHSHSFEHRNINNQFALMRLSHRNYHK